MKEARPVNRDELVGWMFSSPRKEALEGEGPLNTGPEAPVAPAVPVLASERRDSMPIPSHPSQWIHGRLA